MKTPNELIHATSPYLLQHAYNPVQWYAWSEKALQKAGKVGLSDEFITRYMDAIHMESINRQNKIMND